jgi:hypothetical protein
MEHFLSGKKKTLSSHHSTSIKVFLQETKANRCLWLTPVILITQKAEIKRIVVQSQPGQTVLRPCLEKQITEQG